VWGIAPAFISLAALPNWMSKGRRYQRYRVEVNPRAAFDWLAGVSSLLRPEHLALAPNAISFLRVWIRPPPSAAIGSV
jgi:hypothetical protein